MRNQSLHLRFDYRTPIIPISWIPVQIWWCEDWIFLTKAKIQSPHHHIHTGIHDMGIKRNIFLIRRCKDYMGSHPSPVYMGREIPDFRTMASSRKTSPCTSALIIGPQQYPYHGFRCRFRGAKTGSFSQKQKSSHCTTISALESLVWVSNEIYS